MSKSKKKQQGFVLIVSLVLLAAVTILVVNAMGSSTMSERMSGNYMDRNRARMAAEQALTQGLAILQANGMTCLSGCTKLTTGNVASAITAASLPGVWSDTDSASVSIATGQLTSAKYLINWLNNPAFTGVPGKTDCTAYSVMGRGVGLSVKSVVVLQTIAYVCPTD